MAPLTTVLALACLTLAAAAVAEDAQSDLFRVEVIVFAHAQGAPTLRPTDTLPDYSGAVDLERQAEHARPRDLTARVEVPDQYAAQSELSASMDGVWRQLQQNPLYTPLTWRSWYQYAPAGQRTRTVWIHDGQPLAPDDGGLRFGREHYRLEGAISHRQEQLHRIELEIAWRETHESGMHVHILKQNRGIRPNRLEYFDDPWLAAIVLVTPWQPDGDHDREPVP